MIKINGKVDLIETTHLCVCVSWWFCEEGADLHLAASLFPGIHSTAQLNL